MKAVYALATTTTYWLVTILSVIGADCVQTTTTPPIMNTPMRIMDAIK